MFLQCVSQCQQHVVISAICHSGYSSLAALPLLYLLWLLLVVVVVIVAAVVVVIKTFVFRFLVLYTLGHKKFFNKTNNSHQTG